MENNFENKMENLETPNIENIKHQEHLKFGLTNARKSAKLGIWFIGIPLLLVIIGYIKLSILIKMNFYSKFQYFISGNDHSTVFGWMPPLLLIGLPLLAIFINLLAITHFHVNKPDKQLVVTIKYRFKNLIVIIVSAIFILVVLWHILLLNKI
jgi:hypothetical protein